MKVLITGGAGFIGSNFIFYVRKNHPEDQIICLDKLTYAENFSFIEGDICDNALVNRIFEEECPDLVVNFAAESHVDRSIMNPQVFLQTNIIGTSVLMDACRKYGSIRYQQI